MSRGRWIAWGSAAVLLSAAALLLYTHGSATDRVELLWSLALLVAGILIGLAPRLPWLYEQARRTAHAELAAERQGHDAQSARLRAAWHELAEAREALQQDARKAQENQANAQQLVNHWKAKASDAERRRRNATGAAERRRRRLERVSARS